MQSAPRCTSFPSASFHVGDASRPSTNIEHPKIEITIEQWGPSSIVVPDNACPPMISTPFVGPLDATEDQDGIRLAIATALACSGWALQRVYTGTLDVKCYSAGKLILEEKLSAGSAKCAFQARFRGDRVFGRHAIADVFPGWNLGHPGKMPGGYGPYFATNIPQ